MLKNNSKGITLLETFIAAFIFIVSVAAIFTTLLTTRKPAVNNDKQLQAALVLRGTLDDLRSQVKNGMTTNFTGANPHWFNGIGPGAEYKVQYNAIRNADTGAYRVDANVYWPDSMD